MRRKISILVMIFSAACLHLCSAQNPRHKIDSLLQVLKTAKEDTNKVKTLNALAWKLYRSNPDTGIILAKQALSLSEKVKSKKHVADSYHVIAWADFAMGNFPSSLENNFKALSLSEELADKPGIAKSLGYIGNAYSSQGDFPKALDYYFKALKMDEELGNKIGMENQLGNIGIIYSDQGDFLKALDNYFKALKIAEEIGDKHGIAIAFSNIGIIYGQQKDYPKALDYFLKALKMKEELGDKPGIVNELINIGNIYVIQDDYPKSLDYYFKGLKMAEELGNKHGIAILLGSIGTVYSEQGDYSKALDNNFKALKIHQELGDKYGIATWLGSIGSLYIKTGKFSEAEEYLKKANALYDSIGVLDGLRQGEESLAQLYDTTGRYKLALEHYKKAMVVKDTLFNQEKNNEITRKEMNYAFEKTQATEKAAHEKQMAVKNVEIKKQKTLKYSLIGGLALLSLLGVFVFTNFKAKNKLRLQSIRNKIASDLHDDIGSTLNSISVYSEVAKQKSPTVVEELEQIGDASRKIIDAMSDIVWTINPKNDTFENILLRMRSLSYNLLKAKNIEHSFRADESMNGLKLSMEERRNLFLIFKETLNNLVKYSEATRVSIVLSHENNLIKLIVRDNGQGFDAKQFSTGNGLLNMKARAQEIKADINIDSAIGSGTNIELTLKA